MTYKEAAERIKVHSEIHHLQEPHAVHITGALNKAVKVLQWAGDKAEWVFETDLANLLNEYYNEGLHDGWRRCEREMKRGKSEEG